MSSALMIAVFPAYIGPGVGAGAIGAFLAIIGAALLAIFALVYYPLKRLRKARRKAHEEAGPPDKAG
ncbi:MAG: hypothetical protein AAGC81_13430 [Pseudomonadota bacterium]